MERVGARALGFLPSPLWSSLSQEQTRAKLELSMVFLSYSLKNSKDWLGFCLLVVNIPTQNTGVGPAISTLFP